MKLRVLGCSGGIGGESRRAMALLVAEPHKLERRYDIHIAHLKPGQSALIMSETASCLDDFKPQMLHSNQVFEF